MPARPSLPPQRNIAARLRAAGCVYAEEEARLLAAEARTAAELDAMVARRAAGEPVEHVVGWAEFCGLRIAVDRGVFVPRRRTEFLARQAVQFVRHFDGPVHGEGEIIAVDLCAGSGAVGAVLAEALPGIALHAVDVDEAAVACARRNLDPATAYVYQGDLYQPLPTSLAGKISLLVANTPYVPSDALGMLPAEARVYEPRVALDGGRDGLSIARRVLVAAPRWLAPDGHVLIETSEEQAPELCHAASASGLVSRIVSSAELEATVVVSRYPADHRRTQPMPSLL